MKNELMLAISGNDIFSGGGLQADLATYTVRHQHGFVAVTCLTAMTEKGFEINPVDTAVFAQQLHSLKEIPFSAIKIGLLPNVEIAQLTLAFVKEVPEIPVVLDPVLVLKENQDQEVTALRDELLSFFPYATVITPNLAEAQLLTGKEITTLEEMKSAAKTLYNLGAKQIVIKGGNRFYHQKAIDVFYDAIDFHILEATLLDKNNTGAGCTFASSIASYIAQGQPALSAVQKSKDFVHRAIERSDSYGVIQYEL